MILFIGLFLLSVFWRLFTSLLQVAILAFAMIGAYVMYQAHHPDPEEPSMEHAAWVCTPPESYACKVGEADKTRNMERENAAQR
jgi:hypothetical protein